MPKFEIELVHFRWFCKAIWNQLQSVPVASCLLDCKQWCSSWHENTLFFNMIKTEWYITWQSSNPMFKEVTWQKFEATIWFKNDLTFWAFDREINQTRIPDPWDHLNIHNESEMNYHEYSDSVHRHVIRLPCDLFSVTWSSTFYRKFILPHFIRWMHFNLISHLIHCQECGSFYTVGYKKCSLDSNLQKKNAL